MAPLLPLFSLTAAAVATLMFTVWLISLIKKDASVIDAFWGPGFGLVAVVGYLSTTGAPSRKALLTSLVLIWGLRLGIYLAWRNHGIAEDYRYQAMRRRHGSKFPLVSLFTVFGLQGALMWVISLPLQVALASSTPAHLTWLDGVGALFWSTGLFFETVGDLQLARFKSDPANRGRVMAAGLWKYTRHPNYFGDFMVWWGFFLVALATPYGLWTIFSPLMMSFLLMRVSGVPLLEGKLMETRPGYREYVSVTRSFFPWFPRRLPGA